MKRAITVLLYLLMFVCTQIMISQPDGSIAISPNVQVTNDGNFSKAEMMVAVNPLNPDNLIIVSSAFPFREYSSGRLDKIYYTNDGGISWKDTAIKEALEYGSADPQIIFDNHGIAYFTDLLYPIDNESNNKEKRLFFSTSIDGGLSWSNALCLEDNILYGEVKGHDHEQIAVDQSFGKYADRIYIGSTTLELERTVNPTSTHLTYKLWLFRSNNHGKSFIGPYKILENNAFALSTNLLISSEGKLHYTYRLDNKKLGRAQVYLKSSPDGGISFSNPKLILNFAGTHLGKGNTESQFAIDNRSEKYLDRIYCVYIEKLDNININSSPSRVMLSYSNDEGESWSIPRVVDQNRTANTGQYQPAIAVNSNGVVGIRWYDTRGFERGKGYNEYFTASLDGGDTFLKAVKVSEKSSTTLKFNGQGIFPIWERLSLSNAFKIKLYSTDEVNKVLPFAQIAGDYNQFMADSRGIFHDIWTDSRDGQSYQIYTSQIQVTNTSSNSNNLLKIEKTKNKKVRERLPSVKKHLIPIENYVTLSFGQSVYDSITHKLSIPISIKNISDVPIYGPFTLDFSITDTTNVDISMKKTLKAKNKKNQRTNRNILIFGTKNLKLIPGQETDYILWKPEIQIKSKRFPVNEYEKKFQNKTVKNSRIEYQFDQLPVILLNVFGYGLKD